MNKKDLVTAVVEVLGGEVNGQKLTKKNAEVIVDTVFDVIAGELANGGEVSVYGFGKFSVREVAEREGHNPQTMERMTIPAYRTPKFKASSVLKSAIRD